MVNAREYDTYVKDLREGFTTDYWKEQKEEYIRTMRGLANELQKTLDSDIEFFEKVSVVRYALRLMTEETDYKISSGGFKRGADNG